MSRRSKNKTTARTRRAHTGTTALVRIDLLTKNARALWFGMLATLVFASITLFGVQDIDFFGLNRETKLPLIGVTVPVMYFFAAGAALTTAIYIYFHLYLLQLWEELGRIPPRPKGRSLNKAVHPWLVTDTMIRWRSRMRGDKSAHPRALTWISTLSTIALAWLFGPAVLAYFWWRSMPAHDEWLTLLLGVFFLLASYTLLKSALTARYELGQKSNARLKWVQRGLTILLIVAILPLSWMRTENDFGTRLLSQANLRGAYLTQLPADWRPRAHARKWFFAEWCKREALPGNCEGISETQISDRLEEWKVHRQTYLDTLPRPNLRGRDLRGADLANAFLPNVDLSSARLEGADLKWARLEGADLREARLEGADLRSARLEGANLRWARLEGADLRKARLEGADLRWARLEGADLRKARLGGADLGEARLEGANLSSARLEGANLSSARLEGADLSFARLEGADLSWARLEGADLYKARLEGANLRSARLVGAVLYKARLVGADLTGARLVGAVLYKARLEGADLSSARLEGALLTQSETGLNSSDFSAAIGNYMALKLVELTKAKITFDVLNPMFGDASVILPDGIKPPCHWAKTDLRTDVLYYPFLTPNPNDPFIGRWRGWVEANGGAWPTSPRFDKFKDVIAIPPPPECPLIKDM